jgi:hypothetical protein
MSWCDPKSQMVPYALILQKTHLRLLWTRAKAVGFTQQTIWRLLRFVQINPYTMSTATLMQLMPYVNETNAKKFG